MELFDFGIPALDKALNLTATVLLLLALGMLLIRVILRLCDRAFDRSERLAPFRTYLRSTLRAVLYTLLALAVLGSIGVEITSFVALLSVAGLAVWSQHQRDLSLARFRLPTSFHPSLQTDYRPYSKRVSGEMIHSLYVVLMFF